MRKTAASFQEASRAQLSLLAPIEKKCLIWLARHTPRWINSDHLAILGLASLAGAGMSYWYARRNPAGLLLVVLFLILNWLGDSLDGTLARVRNRQRPRYGFYVDHIVDGFGTFFLLGGPADRVFHAVDRGLPRYVHVRHVPHFLLEDESDRTAASAHDRQHRVAVPAGGADFRRRLPAVRRGRRHRHRRHGDRKSGVEGKRVDLGGRRII